MESVRGILEKQRQYFYNGNTLDIENPDVFAYIRELDGDKIVVVCNFTDKRVVFKDESLEVGDSEILLSNYKDSEKLKNTMELRPYEAIMYRM